MSTRDVGLTILLFVSLISFGLSIVCASFSEMTGASVFALASLLSIIGFVVILKENK